MIDVKRSRPAPPSLAEKKGWRGEDVLEALHGDFQGKCYLCESLVAGPGSFEVDHRRPRSAGGDKFDWDNLFPICPPCNIRRRKKWPEGGLLDPAGGDEVERRLVQEIAGWDESNRVIPSFRAVALVEPASVNTADELDHIHNDHSGPGAMKAADLRNAITLRHSRVMGAYLAYRNTSDPVQRVRSERELRRLVARTAPYTALMRSAIREDLPESFFD